MTAKEAEERYNRINPENVQESIDRIESDMERKSPGRIVIDGKLFRQWNFYMRENNRAETEFIMNYFEGLGFTVIAEHQYGYNDEEGQYRLRIRF